MSSINIKKFTVKISDVHIEFDTQYKHTDTILFSKINL